MTEESKVHIEINGVSLEAEKGAMLIEVADAAGIRIPRFCYHRKLSVAANCRMCLVEVEKAPKPLPACATPVMDGMKVFTRSPKAIAAQKGTMEFLLINHPLDCPICDQGGECELQDVAMGYGGDVSRYSEGKRVVPDKNIGPLIATEMTRCIHCTRCVRFGEELAGIRELGATGRGENTRIGTYIESAVASEMSGNVIDLCPVGALTAKPSRYSARAWELTQHDSIAPHDCVGSNISVHTFRGNVNRVVPKENESINECWISDRDRFSYEGLNTTDRLKSPMIKVNGEWQSCDWETALEASANAIRETGATHGFDQLGFLVSPNATVEEMVLANLIAEGTGCQNIDHRLRQSDFSDQDNAPVFPWLGQTIESLEQVDAALLIGSNVRKEQPIIAHRLRKAAMRGANLMFVNTREYDFHFRVAEQCLVSSADMLTALAGIAKSLIDLTGAVTPVHLQHVLANTVSNDGHLAIAQHLKSARKASVLLGNQAQMDPNYAAIRAIANVIASLANAEFGYLSDGANAGGAWLAGVLPHRGMSGKPRVTTGLNASEMLGMPRRGYVLLGIEPEYDCADPAMAMQGIKNADFVVSLTSYVTDTMKEYATILLPVAAFTETSGTFVNAEGRWQGFTGKPAISSESRPAWKVLRVLGNLLALEGFDFDSSEEVRDLLQEQLANLVPSNQLTNSSTVQFPEKPTGLQRISAVATYAEDVLVRRADSLQQTPDGKDRAVRICKEAAMELGLSDAKRVLIRQSGNESSMELKIDDGIPKNCVWVPSGTSENAKLGPMFGPVELEAD